MLSNRKLDRYADVLLWALKTARKENYKRRDIVLIRYDLPALGMAEILQGKLLDMGLNPVLRAGLTPGMERNFFKKANQAQLVFQAPGEKELYEKTHGSIYLHAPESLTHLADMDPKKIGRAALARKPLREILDKREEKGWFGWTLCLFPTPGLARQAGVSLKQYSGQVERACYLDKPDPVGAWKGILRDAGAIKEWINRMDARAYHVESQSMDLRIVPGKRRKWVGISGHNIPSFEIFLSPDWRGTEGVYYADQPSFRNGNLVEKVRLTFSKGSLIKIEAGKGENFLVKQTGIDAGASRIGEFSLTDKRFSRINRFMANTLYDENYGGRFGNCHLALGASYSDTYDGNPAHLTPKKKRQLGFNDSALHWDLVNTEKKRVTALLGSGVKKTIYENGKFMY